MLKFKAKLYNALLVCFVCFNLSACVGTLVGAVVDTTIEVAKVPFKVGGAIIDVATPDDESSELHQAQGREQQQ